MAGVRAGAPLERILLLLQWHLLCQVERGRGPQARSQSPAEGKAPAVERTPHKSYLLNARRLCMCRDGISPFSSSISLLPNEVVHQEQNKLFMKEWPGYGFTLFDVERKEGGFPNDLWLSVSTENVSVCDLWKLSSIVFFGTLQPNTFKLTVDEREMFFETPQVGEIIKTMKAYRDMTVKKCYSIKSAANLDSCASFWMKG